MANPAFNEKTLSKLSALGELATTDAMTMHGTVNKVGILVVLTVLSSAFSWMNAEAAFALPLALVSMITCLILTFVIIFNKEKAPYLAPAYAIAEGMSLGFLSYFIDRRAPGIAMHAFVASFGILFVMVGLYSVGALRATPRFTKTVIGATFGIAAVYLVDLLLSLFGLHVPMIHQNGVYGIAFSVLVIIVASLNFIIDFAMIESAVTARAPKYMEWYGGFAVLLTLIWLYIEILRLLEKVRK